MQKITREDLWKECPKCQMAAKVPPEPAANNFVHVMEKPACPKCGGKGEILTDTGETLRDFIQEMNRRSTGF